jgi:hypothetical protein
MPHLHQIHETQTDNSIERDVSVFARQNPTAILCLCGLSKWIVCSHQLASHVISPPYVSPNYTSHHHL